MKETILIQAEPLKKFCTEMFEKTGMSREEALVNADNLVEADLKGIDSHGVSRLPIHLKRIKIGIVRANYEMKTLSERLSAAVIDACNSMGPYVSVQAMELAIEKARHTGVAFVTVKNSNHNGIAAYYAERALPHGMIGIAATNSKARMAVYGGREPFLGTNPFAVAIPADKQRPIIADMATSVVARGKVAAAAKNKQPLPPGWALDKEGEPTTDSAEGLKGTVVPFAGYKGSAIAMVIDVLTAVLSGSLYGPHVRDLYTDFEEPACISHVFGAVNIEAFTSLAGFKSDIDRMITEIKSAKPAKGVAEIFLPGEIELCRREKWRREGIPLAVPFVDDLRREAEQWQVPFTVG